MNSISGGSGSGGKNNKSKITPKSDNGKSQFSNKSEGGLTEDDENKAQRKTKERLPRKSRTKVSKGKSRASGNSDPSDMPMQRQLTNKSKSDPSSSKTGNMSVEQESGHSSVKNPDYTTPFTHNDDAKPRSSLCTDSTIENPQKSVSKTSPIVAQSNNSMAVNLPTYSAIGVDHPLEPKPSIKAKPQKKKKKITQVSSINNLDNPTQKNADNFYHKPYPPRPKSHKFIEDHPGPPHPLDPLQNLPANLPLPNPTQLAPQQERPVVWNSMDKVQNYNYSKYAQGNLDYPNNNTHDEAWRKVIDKRNMSKGSYVSKVERDYRKKLQDAKSMRELSSYGDLDLEVGNRSVGTEGWRGVTSQFDLEDLGVEKHYNVN